MADIKNVEGIQNVKDTVNDIKKFKSGFQKTLKNIKKIIFALTTPLGQIIASLCVIIFLVITILVLVQVLGGALADYLGGGVGLSTDADYEYMVSSIGYAGYDSLISEKNFQEYMAYEYAALMDVAEYLYEGQQPEVVGGAAVVSSDPPATMPYLETKVLNDIEVTNEQQWKKLVIAGQSAERPFSMSDVNWGGVTPPNQITTSMWGGNKNVVEPILSYEYKLNSYDTEQGSLVPYITVVRDDLKYHYYSTVPSGEEWTFAADGTAIIDESNIDKLNLLTVNYKLNANNGALPRTYDYARKQISDGGDEGLIDTSSVNAWPVVESDFSRSMYYNDWHDSVVYKISLKTLIDRYLPKANLLTSWFLLKDTDAADSGDTGKQEATGLEDKGKTFGVTELMRDIKGIYNYYCWNGETINSEDVYAVQYDEVTGAVERDESGEAVMELESRKYATTNDNTFIKFGQVGLETNRFEVFRKYAPTEVSAPYYTTNPRANKAITGDVTERTIPIITDLLSDSAYFLETIEFSVGYTYEYDWEYYDDAGECIGTGSGYGYYVDSGDSNYVSGDVTGEDRTVSDMILKEVIKPAESEMMLDDTYTKVDRGVKQDFVNYEYVFPTKTAVVGGQLRAEQPPSFYDSSYREHDIAFYNFSVSPNAKEVFEEKLNNRITSLIDNTDFRREWADLADIPRSSEPKYDSYSGEEHIWVDTNPNPEEFTLYPNIAKAVKTIKNNTILVSEIIYSGDISFKCLKDNTNDGPHNPYRAVFDVAHEKIAMSLTVHQKRMPAVLVTQAETWAKSVNYQIDITQNSFDPNNKYHVVPHCGYHMGLNVFNITENPQYRVEYYAKYFSKVDKEEPGIKEADVLSMLMNWENLGTKGESSAYNFMRDLYKLVLYTREKGKIFQEAHPPEENPANPGTYIYHDNPYILKDAYTYLYQPKTIWGFDEGKTQEIFWLERLTAKEAGNVDAFSKEEQEKIVTKDNEISWQLLDYEDYEECSVGDDIQVYALFPYGNELVRTYYMEDAIANGSFDSGGNTTGHRAVDWHSRAKLKAILDAGKRAEDGTLASQIYYYELMSRTLRKILSGPGTLDEKYEHAKNFTALGAVADIQQQYDEAKKELDAYLEESYIESPIVAIAPGIVTAAGYNARAGFYVEIKHTNDNVTHPLYSSYCHFRRWPNVNVGDLVGAGTVLGYEGSTGNSTGSHLHFSLKRQGDAGYDTPTAYLAPIYTPFYNADKITEFLLTHKLYETNKLILSTEYMSLARTVLMARFDSADQNKIQGITLPDPTLLESTSIVTATESGELKEFITIKNEGRLEFHPYHDADHKTHCIIKVGVQPNEKYYDCVYEEVQNKAIENGVLIDWYGGRILRIIEKTRIDTSGALYGFAGITVKTGTGTGASDYENVGSDELKWGVNTPVKPLLSDFKDLLNKGTYEEKASFDSSYQLYARTDNSSNTVGNKVVEIAGASGKPWTDKTNDIRVGSELFKVSSSIVSEKVTYSPVPADTAMCYSDLQMDYAVPFYDGPFTKEFASSNVVTPGSYGSRRDDLAALQTAIVARGFDNSPSERKMNTIGDYDAVTKSVLVNVGNQLQLMVELDDSFLTQLINNGAIGKKIGTTASGKEVYSIQSIVGWNTYITYGSERRAKQAADAAIANATVHYPGLGYKMLYAIANCESGRIPSNESNQLYKQASMINYDFSSSGALPYKFEYKGETRIIRRAQGLFQIAPGNCTGYFSGSDFDEAYLTALRTPATNALMACDMMNENREAIIEDAALMNQIRNIARLEKWQKLAKAAGEDATDLVLSAVIALAHNKGLGGAKGEISKFEDMSYTTTDRGRYTIFEIENCPGYTGKVLEGICSET